MLTSTKTFVFSSSARGLFQQRGLANLQAAPHVQFANTIRCYRSLGMTVSRSPGRSSRLHHARQPLSPWKLANKLHGCARDQHPTISAFSSAQLLSAAKFHVGAKEILEVDGYGTADADTIAAIVAGVLHACTLQDCLKAKHCRNIG
jgi:hypothetical protein